MDWIVNMIRAGMQPGAPTLAGMIRRDAVPYAETEEDVQRMEGTYRAPPPVAVSETGVRSLERQMWPENFDERGTPRFPFPMADAMADHPSAGGPQRIEDVRQRMTNNAPMPPRRPPAHTAPANPGPPQAAPQAPRQQFSGSDNWIPPDQGDAQNRALLAASARGEAGPQFQAQAATNLAGMTPNAQTSYASGSGNPPPGSGLMAFLNSGAVPVFKQDVVDQTNALQGPVLPHDMQNKRVGVVEGSAAHNFQESPMGKLFGLLGGGPFGV